VTEKKEENHPRNPRRRRRPKTETTTGAIKKQEKKKKNKMKTSKLATWSRIILPRNVRNGRSDISLQKVNRKKNLSTLSFHTFPNKKTFFFSPQNPLQSSRSDPFSFSTSKCLEITACSERRAGQVEVTLNLKFSNTRAKEKRGERG